MKITKMLFAVASFILCSHSYAINHTITSIEKNYLECSIKYENNGDSDQYGACSELAVKNMLELTAIQRSQNDYPNKESWKKTNLSLNNYLLKCENNARNSQKNSTIKKDISSCQFFYARSLAYEASILNH